MRKEVKTERKLRNKQFYTSGQMKAGHTTLMGKMRNAYGILVGNLFGKRPIGRFGHRDVLLEYVFKDKMCESVFGMNVAGNKDH